MSGWWLAASAASPIRLTNRSPVAKSPVRKRVCSACAIGRQSVRFAASMSAEVRIASPMTVESPIFERLEERSGIGPPRRIPIVENVTGAVAGPARRQQLVGDLRVDEREPAPLVDEIDHGREATRRRVGDS